MISDRRPHRATKVIAWWSVVFAANLLVPLPLGLIVLRESGYFGMFTAIVVCWVAGLITCLRSNRLADVFINGGVWIALSQMLPFLQVFTGLLGAFTWQKLTGKEHSFHGGLRSELSAFAVTILTALPLFFAAWLLGGGPRLLFSKTTIDGPEAADYGEPTTDKSGPPTEHPHSADS